MSGSPGMRRVGAVRSIRSDAMRSRVGVFVLVSTLAALSLVTTHAPAAYARADAGWQRQEPQPAPWPFRDVDMITADEAWTVARPTTGDHGLILHTTDGGVSWSQQGGTFRQLNTVSFADADHGVALGNELRYTTDGGATWKQGSGIAGTIYDVEMAGTSVAYGVGGNRVIKTTNGGATWTSTGDLDIDGNLVSVDVVDASTVYAVGAEGSAFRTTDGGSTWKLVRRDPDLFYSGVSFVSATEGWISGDAPPTILHTTDAGAHWTSQAIPQQGDAQRIRMVDAKHGWAVGTLRTILHTDDGGQTWVLQQGGVYAVPDNRYPYWGIDAIDASTAVAVGAGVQIATTTDAGNTWHTRGNGSATVPYRLVRTDPQHLWAANSDSEVLYSTDGGVRWSRSIIQVSISCDTCSNTSDLAFVNNQEGWATINGEFTSTSWVWHTTDGGVTWQSLDVTDTGPLTGIAALDAKTLVAVSAVDDLISRSTDGGRSWKPISHPHIPGFFGALRFVPGTTTGWAVGYGGKILRTTDGGKSWVLQHGDGSQPNLFDVSFSDTKHGWAVGGQTLHTSNGGKTWKVQQSGISIGYGVSAPSKKVAWLAGLNGLAQSTDGGKHWSHESPVDGAWYSMTSLDAKVAWAGAQEQIDDIPGSIWKHAGRRLGPADGSAAAPSQPPGAAHARGLLSPPSAGT